MRLYCNHEEEADSISDEEMVDGDANIDDEEMMDGDANIDDEERRNDLELRISSDRCSDRRVCANLQVFRRCYGIEVQIVGLICGIEATGEGSSVILPSPIQSHAWSVLLNSRDLIGIAKTGSVGYHIEMPKQLCGLAFFCLSSYAGLLSSSL
ncbi:hypothetical protein Sjap_022046 [Stephania japonica]|uniref:Uncharacterized protein n=1 Tax=Stephania japonica TaxID=461633 RepID=A0AAP0EWX3_9MAGN